jgi:hypothetical protein
VQYVFVELLIAFVVQLSDIGQQLPTSRENTVATILGMAVRWLDSDNNSDTKINKVLSAFHF